MGTAVPRQVSVGNASGSSDPEHIRGMQVEDDFVTKRRKLLATPTVPSVCYIARPANTRVERANKRLLDALVASTAIIRIVRMMAIEWLQISSLLLRMSRMMNRHLGGLLR